MGLLDSNKTIALSKSVNLNQASIASAAFLSTIDVKGYNTLIINVRSISSGGSVRFQGYVGVASSAVRLKSYKTPQTSLQTPVENITETGLYYVDVALFEAAQLYNINAVTGGTITADIYLSQEKYNSSGVNDTINAINSIKQKESIAYTTGEMDLSTTGVKLTIADIDKHRNEYVKLDIQFSGVDRYEELNIYVRDFAGYLVSSSGHVFSKITSAAQFSVA